MITYSSIPSTDAMMYEPAPDDNYTLQTTLQTGYYSITPSLSRNLIKYDLSSISADAIVESAVLNTYKTDDESAFTTAATAYLYRCKRAWVSNQATWNSWKTGNAWTGAGADNTADRDTTAIGSCDFVYTSDVGTLRAFTLTTALVQEWINGTFTNNGLVMKGTETDLTFRYVGAKSHATSGYRPTLVIVYYVPGFFYMFN